MPEENEHENSQVRSRDQIDGGVNCPVLDEVGPRLVIGVEDCERDLAGYTA